MNDLILNSYVDKFVESFGLEKLESATQFEYFVNYCVVSRDYQTTFDVSEISTGSSLGIDGLAIFVNDALVLSPTEIEGVALRRIDSRFLFTQSKTSTSLDLGEFLKFLSAVEMFFRPTTQDEDLKTWLDIKKEIYQRAIKFDENPTLSLIFAYTGVLQINDTFQTQINSFKERLLATSLFNKIDVQIFDAEKLKTIYRALSNKITRQINFDKFTILPKINGVKRAFIGILSCKEYLKLISDENGNLTRNVFYDNVRDFQGENSVNREIVETLKADQDGSQFFVLLNNGVTIVAKSINPVGNEFTVRDFQVVNGCQTSHILFNNKDILSGDEFISIKLIETDDVELTNKITKATNRQTEVKLEAFAGLEQFHKELEAFYSSFPLSKRLYYERRSGQYDGESSVSHNRIITIPVQIKSFVSVFLEEPDQIHYYYGKLLEDYSKGDSPSLFNEGHDIYPYFIGSWLVFKLNDTLKHPSSIAMKRWRFHLAMMVRILLAGPFSKNRLTDAKYCKKYCDNLLKVLDDNTSFVAASKQAISILKNNIQLSSHKKEEFLIKSGDFSKDLSLSCIKLFQQDSKQDFSNTPKFDGFYVGKIKVVVKERKFGFIQYGERQFFFRLGGSHFAIGQNVRFKLQNVHDKTEAHEVMLIN